ncbi:MAG TPA: pyruvate, phosphate dikinase [Alphaproteobacteria bacterium]
MAKWVYGFGDGAAEGSAAMKELLGGKGANLAEMAGLGLPVPPGFTITTEVCTFFYTSNRSYPPDLEAEVDAALGAVARLTGKRFGDPANPLLISVRSGARASMPGMMDTVLNLGLNDETVEAIAKAADARFAWDSYRRFIQMYGNVVLGVEHHEFEAILELEREKRGAAEDTDMTAEAWQAVVALYKQVVEDTLEKPFPQNPQEQLWGALGAVFGSWMNARAIAYRQLHDIPANWGTAVNVQAMVFGNMGETSATGVAFTRNPSTGEKALYGEFLVNAQGEDVVAGIRTPQDLTEAARQASGSRLPSLETVMPDAFAEFRRIAERLESHYRDMQDVEFTIENGKLWMLQTRSGKRTAKAALKIAVDMAAEGLITREEAIGRIEPNALDQLLHPTLDPDAARTLIARGLPASPGAATGEIVFTAEEAERLKSEGRDVVLVRNETSPEDIHGMVAAVGIVTARGGMTSHAAVVARGMGKPCVCGAGALKIDAKAGTMTVAGKVWRAGDLITLDGASGGVFDGRVATLQPELTGDFGTLMGWADAVRRMQVRANAETPTDARAAREFGAEGIGLCRTEHMFFDGDRILAVREMILADDSDGRRAALEKLLPMQRDDFRELFSIMRGLPVTIRLLDPPLHEFLPTTVEEIEHVAAAAGLDVDAVHARAAQLKESNPMLGHRGCRLGIAYPEIYEMQARAIFEAALEVKRRHGTAPVPEIMIPLVATGKELALLKARIAVIAAEVEAEAGERVEHTIGTMIELPRAALLAGEIALEAEFFSFGTNDLTQTTYGISRDDAGKFVPAYLQKEIYADDPFATLDAEGVGRLMQIGVEGGRSTRPEIKLGICGEHGGDPRSIRFCQDLGLDYVSCSPFRVPIARLAAAQAALAERE